MKKRNMISVVASSLLTAAIIFTGCGGGGSAAGAGSETGGSGNSSSVSSSAESSSSAPKIKKVTVSDGWVLGATVKCKDNADTDVAVGSATEPVGSYEIDITGKSCEVLCAKDGYIDVDSDGKITMGEPKAPQMGAPGNFTHITPYSTFIRHGISVADLEAATGLSADAFNGFDMAVPVANDADYAKQAILLSAAIAYIQAGGESTSSVTDSSSSSESSSSNTSGGILPGPRGILPGPQAPVDTHSSDSSAATSSAAGTTVLTYATLIERMKNGESIDQIIPQLADLVKELNAVSPQDYSQDPNIFDKKAQPYLSGLTGKCMEDVCVSAAVEDNAEQSSSSVCLPGDESCGKSSVTPCLPGDESCNKSSTQTNSSESSSDANASSSSEAIESSSSSYSSSGGILPGPSN